jgi:Co/Zn/Cd efflux system component
MALVKILTYQTTMTSHHTQSSDTAPTDCCTSNIHQDHGLSDMAVDPKLRKVLWAALIINALMFFIEVGAGFQSGSVALLADAVDFFSDAANYAITLYVLSMGFLWRARAATFKGITMLLIGLLVMGKTLWAIKTGQPPEAFTMGVIGALALVANVAVASMLYAFRNGDANMQSVWLCSRNDAIGNVAVILAALGVFGTGTAWPDIAVAALMTYLSITAGWKIMHLAHAEIHTFDEPEDGSPRKPAHVQTKRSAGN